MSYTKLIASLIIMKKRVCKTGIKLHTSMPQKKGSSGEEEGVVWSDLGEEGIATVS